jgi:hypothetical protein
LAERYGAADSVESKQVNGEWIIKNEGATEETAYHEAGHAVVGFALGCPPLAYFTIARNPEENSRGEWSHLPWTDPHFFAEAVEAQSSYY